MEKLIFHLSFDIFHLSFKNGKCRAASPQPAACFLKGLLLLPPAPELLSTAHRRRLHSERNLRAAVLCSAAQSGVSCQRICSAHAVGLHS